VTGGCLCGAIRYRVDAQLGALVNCHCQYCRRAHGAAFATSTIVATKNFTIVEGEERITRYLGRFFCSECGSSLFNRLESSPKITALLVASLDEAPETTPALHCNVESKAAWYSILDDKPQFEGFPPSAKEILQKATSSD
jgi:hypothetical protein